MERREHRAPEQPTNRLGAQLLRTALAPLHLTVREPLLAAEAPGSGQRLSRRKSRGERSNDHISCGLFDPDSKVHMPSAPYGMLLKGGPDKSVPLANSAAMATRPTADAVLDCVVSMSTPNSSRQVPGTMQAGYMRFSLGTDTISESILSTIYEAPCPRKFVTCLYLGAGPDNRLLLRILAQTSLPSPRLHGLYQQQWDSSRYYRLFASGRDVYPRIKSLHESPPSHQRQTMDIATHSTLTLTPAKRFRHQASAPGLQVAEVGPPTKHFKAHHYTKCVPFSAPVPGRGASASRQNMEHVIRRIPVPRYLIKARKGVQNDPFATATQ
ncbi:hypothetical protein V8C44DRAFT_230786 [Trichoderma aethiopicum]